MINKTDMEHHPFHIRQGGREIIWGQQLKERVPTWKLPYKHLEIKKCAVCHHLMKTLSSKSRITLE